MIELAEVETLHRTRFLERIQVFGPAMRFVLLLARACVAPRAPAAMPYAHELPDDDVHLPPFTLLWDLAERYHPEQTWLTELWTRRERSLGELVRTAPREPLARGLIEETRQAESRGLWSSAMPLGQVCGVRASLRSALLESNETRGYPR